MKRRVALLSIAAFPGLLWGAREWVTPEVNAPRVERRLFDSRAVGGKVSYFVYTPAAYDADPETRFPQSSSTTSARWNCKRAPRG